MATYPSKCIGYAQQRHLVGELANMLEHCVKDNGPMIAMDYENWMKAVRLIDWANHVLYPRARN